MLLIYCDTCEVHINVLGSGMEDSITVKNTITHIDSNLHKENIIRKNNEELNKRRCMKTWNECSVGCETLQSICYPSHLYLRQCENMTDNELDMFDIVLCDKCNMLGYPKDFTIDFTKLKK